MRVVVDWDGTVTDRDTLELVVQEFGDRAVWRRLDDAIARGEMTLHEVMEAEFATVRAPLEEVNAWLAERARIRPGFAELVAEHDVTVLSSSFTETILPVLARARIEVAVLANSLDARPDGWRIRWRDETVCAHCEQSCKRAALPAGEIAFVGDGYSDRCAALAATRVFARDGLASYLEAEGAPFERWDDFFDVARALAGAAVDARTTSRGLK